MRRINQSPSPLHQMKALSSKGISTLKVSDEDRKILDNLLSAKKEYEYTDDP